MSLDVDLIVTQPVSVFDANITHNLGPMAAQVKLSNGMTLYDVLWRPDEQYGLLFARDIAELLDEGWNILLADPVGVHMMGCVILYISTEMHVGIILMLN